MDLKLATSLWKLGHLRSDELPEIAVTALEAGFDSPSLRILAGETRAVWADVAPLFSKSLDELGIEIPDRRRAIVAIAKHYAGLLVTGAVSPSEGASQIWYQLGYEEETPHQIGIFASLVSEYDDWEYRVIPDPRAKEVLARIERDAVSAARVIIQDDWPGDEPT